MARRVAACRVEEGQDTSPPRLPCTGLLCGRRADLESLEEETHLSAVTEAPTSVSAAVEEQSFKYPAIHRNLSLRT